MNKISFLNKISWIALLLIILIALCGGNIMPKPIDPLHKISFIKNPDLNALPKYLVPPFAPNNTFILGTDHRGYDILSLILNGMKYTLFITMVVTIARFIIALPLGFIVAMTGKGKRVIILLQLIFSSVPIILFIYPPLIGLYYGLGLSEGVSSGHPNQFVFSLVFIFLVSIVGAFPLADQIHKNVLIYKQKEYITMASLLGASIWRKIIFHIIPNMSGEFVFIFFAEFIQVMFILGQIAALGVYMGGGESISLSNGLTISLTTTGEWFGLIAYSSTRIREFPWIILSVGLFYIVTVLLLYFFLNEQKKYFFNRSDRK